MVIDISDGCLPPHASHVVILDTVQGKGSILRCYLHGRSIGYFISQKWNLRLCGVVQPVACCWARGTPGLLSPSESASNSSSWQTFFFFFFNKKKYIFWPRCTACRISVPRTGIERAPPALRALSLNQRTPREVPPDNINVCTTHLGLCLQKS